MAKLIYSTITSLDGFIEDSDGSFDWYLPSAEVHQFFNDQFRSVRTHLYGRRLYETMAVWETMDLDEPMEGMEHLQEAGRDFQQIWRGADKIVYSKTIEEVWTPRTELKASFDADDLRALKDSADSDLIIGGAGLATAGFEAGVIDEVHLTIAPVAVGSGKSALPINQRLDLELLEERRFEDGAVHLKYKLK